MHRTNWGFWYIFLPPLLSWKHAQCSLWYMLIIYCDYLFFQSLTKVPQFWEYLESMLGSFNKFQKEALQIISNLAAKGIQIPVGFVYFEFTGLCCKVYLTWFIAPLHLSNILTRNYRYRLNPKCSCFCQANLLGLMWRWRQRGQYLISPVFITSFLLVHFILTSTLVRSLYWESRILGYKKTDESTWEKNDNNSASMWKNRMLLWYICIILIPIV